MLLDAHGTLLELQPPAPALRRVLAERFGVEVSAAQAEHAIASEIAYYRRHLHEGRDDPSVEELRGRCSQVLRRALAAEHLLGTLGADELTQALLDSLRFRAYPEVPEVLGELRRREHEPHPVRSLLPGSQLGQCAGVGATGLLRLHKALEFVPTAHA